MLFARKEGHGRIAPFTLRSCDRCGAVRHPPVHERARREPLPVCSLGKLRLVSPPRAPPVIWWLGRSSPCRRTRGGRVRDVASTPSFPARRGGVALPAAGRRTAVRTSRLVGSGEGGRGCFPRSGSSASRQSATSRPQPPREPLLAARGEHGNSNATGTAPWSRKGLAAVGRVARDARRCRGRNHLGRPPGG